MVINRFETFLYSHVRNSSALILSTLR